MYLLQNIYGNIKHISIVLSIEFSVWQFTVVSFNIYMSIRFKRHTCGDGIIVWHVFLCRVRDRKALTQALTVDPIYLQHEHDGKHFYTKHVFVAESLRHPPLEWEIKMFVPSGGNLALD